MTTCPNGHVSNDPEWCDTCGAPLAANGGTGSAASDSPASSPSPAQPAAAAPPIGASGGSAAAPGATTACPACGDVNPASNLFCESCGLDFVTGQAPPAPPVLPPASPMGAAPLIAAPAPIEPPEPIDPGTDLGWTITLTVDTEWFAAKGEGIGTPPTRAERVQELRHSPLVIGRTRSSGKNPGIVVDDDHGISRRHAELTHDAQSNTWSITDLGSTNGTFVVGTDTALDASLAAIPANTPTPVGPTDRIFVGAWTRLVLTPAPVAAVPGGDPAVDPDPDPDLDPVVDPAAEPDLPDPAADPPAQP